MHISMSMPPDVMILAGGLGTRLKNTVGDRQKVVAAVDGRPFISFIFEQLRQIEIGKLILCTGHMHETVTEAIRDSLADYTEVIFSHESSPLGTGGALRQALEYSTSPVVLAMNGDSFFDCALTEFIASYQNCGSPAMLMLTEVADVSRYGSVSFTGNRITAFHEKGSGHGAGLVNAGIYLLARETIAKIPLGTNYSLEKQLFPELAVRGLLAGCRGEGRFIDIGTAESYALAQSMFKE